MEEELEIIPIIQIPEQMIRASAEILKHDANNAFKHILEASNKFKEAGMTPVYLYDRNTMNISLIVLETFGRKLHHKDTLFLNTPKRRLWSKRCPIDMDTYTFGTIEDTEDFI